MDIKDVKKYEPTVLYEGVQPCLIIAEQEPRKQTVFVKPGDIIRTKRVQLPYVIFAKIYNVCECGCCCGKWALSVLFSNNSLVGADDDAKLYKAPLSNYEGGRYAVCLGFTPSIKDSIEHLISSYWRTVFTSWYDNIGTGQRLLWIDASLEDIKDLQWASNSVSWGEYKKMVCTKAIPVPGRRC